MRLASAAVEKAASPSSAQALPVKDSRSSISIVSPLRRTPEGPKRARATLTRSTLSRVLRSHRSVRRTRGSDEREYGRELHFAVIRPAHGPACLKPSPAGTRHHLLREKVCRRSRADFSRGSEFATRLFGPIHHQLEHRVDAHILVALPRLLSDRDAAPSAAGESGHICRDSHHVTNPMPRIRSRRRTVPSPVRHLRRLTPRFRFTVRGWVRC